MMLRHISLRVFSPFPLSKGLWLICCGLVCLSVAPVLAAGPVYWDWPSGRAFTEMEHQGTAVNEQGQLVRGLDNRPVGPSGPEVFWTMADDGQGGFYLGSGHGGELYHDDGQGGKTLLAQLEGTEIFSILPLDDNQILVGCGPDGQIYHVDEGGQTTLVTQVPGGYVWDMIRQEESGVVWVATGSPAAVYRLDLTLPKLEEVHSLAAQNCLALAWNDAGQLLLGTQGPGLVCRLDPDKPVNLKVVYQAPQDEVRQFIPTAEGMMFLALDSDEEGLGSEIKSANGKNGAGGTNFMSLFGAQAEPAVSRSAIYLLADDDLITTHWSGNLDLMMAARTDQWGLLAGGPLAESTGTATLFRLLPPAGSYPVASWEGGDILDILVQGHQQEQRVFVAQAHPGGVREVGQFTDSNPEAISPPLVAGQITNWGRLNWTGFHQKGKLKWSVRGGNSAEPDAGWSGWSDTWSDNDHVIQIPPSRFLQWKVQLPRSLPVGQPGVQQVTVSAWQDNLPPVVRNLVLENITDISMGGMMNGSENVTQTFRSGLKAEYSRSSRMDRRAEGNRAAVVRPVRVFTWQGNDPNGDRLKYNLDYLRQGDTAWRQIMAQTPENIGSWDTSDVPDGRYRVRLTASDEADNPAHLALSAATETGPIVVDNTPPRVKDFKIQGHPNGFEMWLYAWDEVSNLATATIILPDGSRQRLDPVDKICDSRKETFHTNIAWPVVGKPAGAKPWQVRVEIRDMNGNLAVAEGELPLEQD